MIEIQITENNGQYQCDYQVDRTKKGLIANLTADEFQEIQNIRTGDYKTINKVLGKHYKTAYESRKKLEFEDKNNQDIIMSSLAVGQPINKLNDNGERIYKLKQQYGED